MSSAYKPSLTRKECRRGTEGKKTPEGNEGGESQRKTFLTVIAPGAGK